MSSAISRLLRMSVALILVALPAGTGAAQQGILPVEVRYSIATIVGPAEICVGVAETYSVRVEKQVGYDNAGSTQWITWGGVAAVVTFTTSGAPQSPALAGPDGIAQKVVTASSAGKLTITASATVMADGLPAPPTSITVTATDCKFQIQQMSIWYHLREGFKPWVGGLVDPLEFEVRLRGAPAGEQGPLRTFAIGRFDCPISFDVEDVIANFQVDMPRENVLHYVIGYTPGTATVTITCPTPVNPVGGTSKPGPFSLDAIDGEVVVGTMCVLVCWTIKGPVVGKHVPHVLHQQSDANGLTYVIVEPK